MISENEIKNEHLNSSVFESEIEEKPTVTEINESSVKVEPIEEITEEKLEVIKTNSELEHENNTTDDDEACNIKLMRSELVTFSHNSSSVGKLHKTDLPSYLLFGACAIAIVAIGFAIVISYVNSLKTDIDFMMNRISVLEDENRVLREKLLELTNQSKNNFQAQQKQMNNEEVKFTRPKTKNVYNGESEEVVKVIDKENMLPDFCYFTEESDLFSEYNKDLCDRIESQLNSNNVRNQKSKKGTKRKKKTIDDSIIEKLNSMNEEIENIKNKRKKGKNSSQGKNNNSSEKRRNKKVKENNNWMDERAKYREQVRKDHDTDADEEMNWFLKRKDEREINRNL